jgi:hypothetical protein
LSYPLVIVRATRSRACQGDAGKVSGTIRDAPVVQGQPDQAGLEVTRVAMRLFGEPRNVPQFVTDLWGE